MIVYLLEFKLTTSGELFLMLSNVLNFTGS